MAISIERGSEALTVMVEGRIDGSNATEFLEEVQSVIAQQDSAVFLDFTKLNYISSAGLRVILLIAKDLRQRKVQFGVCSLSTSVHEIFSISGFDQIIKVHDSSASAVASLGS